jgi:PAS domain S-box-containing protein
MLMTRAVELEAKRVQLSAFINSATEGFMMFDEDMRYIEANKSWLQYAELERKDVIGKHVLEVVPRLKETGRYDDYLKVLETGEPVEFRAVESVSGQGRIQDVSAFKAGDILGIITRDVSGRVRFQERLEALHLCDEILVLLHHPVSLGALVYPNP